MFNTFRGGVHPPQRKTLSMNKGIENLSVPQICYIPMLQHTGNPAKLVVKKGDIVSEGELIGEALDYKSANIHASVPGKVIDIIESEDLIIKNPIVVIEAEGAFTTTGSTSGTVNDWRNLDKQVLLGMVHNSGVVGLGGASVPSADKLSQPPDSKVDTLLINGTESEPYITIDDIVMQAYSDEIVEGVMISLKIIGIKKAIICIDDDKKNAIIAMNDSIKKIGTDYNITVKKLRSKYPQGSEKQLIYSVLKRKIPVTGTAFNRDVVVFNVGTIYAIRESVLFNKPLIERFITVSGEMINKPGNYKIRIGTRISDIIEECEGLKGTPAKIVVGGPLQGFAVSNMDTSVLKGTSAILFLSEKETCLTGYSPCIRCGKCLSACPAGLIPRDIAEAVEKNKFQMAGKLRVEACIKCSCCSYVCPAKRPLSYFVGVALKNLSEKE